MQTPRRFFALRAATQHYTSGVHLFIFSFIQSVIGSALPKGLARLGNPGRKTLIAEAAHCSTTFFVLLLASGALTACGGGAVFIGDGVSATLNVPPASGNGTEVLSVVVQEPAGRNCARGGSRVESGLDLNHNQVLEFSEINTTRYVCNA